MIPCIWVRLVLKYPDKTRPLPPYFRLFMSHSGHRVLRSFGRHRSAASWKIARLLYRGGDIVPGSKSHYDGPLSSRLCTCSGRGICVLRSFFWERFRRVSIFEMDGFWEGFEEHFRKKAEKLRRKSMFASLTRV